MSRFVVLDSSLELIGLLRGPLELLRPADPKLYDQLHRAATSIALNVAEGNQRLGRDRRQFFAIAAGSAAEVRVGLQVAKAWGSLQSEQLEEVEKVLDQVIALLWGLTH